MSTAHFADLTGPFEALAVRLVLHGHDVTVADAGLARALRAAVAGSQLPALYDRPLPARGAIGTGPAAGAAWVFASEPGTGTDGALRVGPEGDAQLDAFAPADLLPAIEVWGPEATRLAALLRDLGCDPVPTRGGAIAALRRGLSQAAGAAMALLPGGPATDAEALARLIGHGLGPQDAIAGPHMASDRLGRGADLVAVMRALKWQGRGVGAHLLAADQRLGGLPEALDQMDLTRPLPVLAQVVPPDWADYNGHMTEARYLDAFGRATDRVMALVGCDGAYVAAGLSFFTAETHICHLAETRIGDPIRVETQLLAAPGRKMHLFHRMWSGDSLRATGEHMLIHVSLDTRRACPYGAPVAERLAAVAAGHAALPRPEQAGRAVG